MRRFIISLSILFGFFFFSMPVHAVLPVLDIKAAGLDGPVAVAPTLPVDITVSLDPGGYTGYVAEWWIAAMTAGGSYFLDNTLTWVRSDTPIPLGHIPLFNLPPTSVLNTTLPVGAYTFHFALDTTTNGMPDAIALMDSVSVTSSQQAPAAITLSSSPSQILADGAKTSTITAYVASAGGVVVPDGTAVAFTTTAGTLSTNQTTTINGFARVTLTSSTTPATATVTGRAGIVLNTTTVTFVPAVAAITVIRDPASIPADGVSYAIVTATLTDGFGNPAPKGTQVTFETTLGVWSNGQQTHEVSLPDASGVMANVLRGTTVGTATVTVSAAGVISLPVTVQFYSVAPAAISLTADPSSLPADGESTSTLRAFVTDGNGDPVPDGQVITFSVVVGTGTLSASTAATSAGIAIVTYRASTTNGPETIKAAAANGIEATADILLFGSSTPVSISLGTSTTTVKSDNSDSAVITATVQDISGAGVRDEIVLFETDRGWISDSWVLTDARGEAAITFSCGTADQSNGVANVIAEVVGLDSRMIPIAILGSTLSLTSLLNNLPRDGSCADTLTITARNAGGIPIYDTLISLSVDPASVGNVSFYPQHEGTTDVYGQFQTEVTAAEGSAIGAVIVQATGVGTSAYQNYTVSDPAALFEIVLPQSSGDEPFSAYTRNVASLALTPSDPALPGNNSIAFHDTNPDTITRSDGGSFIADNFKAGDTIMVGGSAFNDGVYTVTAVTTEGTKETLTLSSSDVLTTEPAGEFVVVTNGVLVRVKAPGVATVAFTTTVGVWDGGASSIALKPVTRMARRPVANDHAWAVLTSDHAGAATVQAVDPANPSTSAKTTIVFSAPSADAARITLQSSAYVVAPSTGGITHSATLTARVYTSTNQVVGGAPVAFSIENATGGGETVSPAVVITDASGVAQTTFTSGTLSTGAEGVTVNAWVIGEGKTTANTTIAFFGSAPNDSITRGDSPPFSFVTDGFEAGEQIRVQGSEFNDGYYTLEGVSGPKLVLVAGDSLNDELAGRSITISAVTTSVSIVIGGTPGSVVIGRGTEITSPDPATYALPMSVLVADSNGNPVPGAVVTLSAWPEQYSSGVWYDLYDVTDEYRPYITGTFANEDKNENMILDPGEDTDGDGKLTPPSSAAGNLPTTVTVDANGVGNFSLVYLKNSAIWIVARVRASTFVLGTETTSSLTFRLPAELTEAYEGLLPDSAYPIGFATGKTTEVTCTFPQFGEAGSDVFTTTSNLLAGASWMEAAPDDHVYRYDPTGGTPAEVGDVVWDWITATGEYDLWDIRAVFPVRIIIK